jgi:hypothetical protein
MRVPQPLQRHGQQLDIGMLPTGHYVIELYTAPGNAVRRRFIKN